MKADKTSKEYVKRYELGQFFTSESLVKKIIKVFDVAFEHKSVLEPSCGEGSFVNMIRRFAPSAEITAVDIDENVRNNYRSSDVKFVCDDFLMHTFNEKFDIVIGNPPFNLKTRSDYCDTTEGFIIKGLELLKPEGNLYLVLPSTVLRNKQYQKVREYIAENYKIEGIMDTSEYDFLGADIETVVLHVKNQKTESQKYFYLKGEKKNHIAWKRNERCTFHINDLEEFNVLNKKIGRSTIGELFHIYRGRGKAGKLIRGRDIDFYGCYYGGKASDQVIGIQNVAYRFTANVISADLKNIADTITLLVPKERMPLKKLIFYSEYLNTSIANYLIQCDAINDCRLTIHMDKYYIENISVPAYVESSSIFENIREHNGDFVLAKNRNEIFYEILKLSEKEIARVEDKWTFPRYKTKSKKLALEV